MMTTTIREKPILFSAPMVRAILSGQKTMTRRVIKPQPTMPVAGFVEYSTDPKSIGRFRFADSDDDQGEYIRFPYGTVGDRLWVRETFDLVNDPAAYHVDDGERENTGYQCKDAIRRGTNDERWVVDYAADENCRVMDKIGDRKWKPSIFMPRWASRLTLEITGIRVERLHQIRDSDVRAEGFDCPEHDFPGGMCVGPRCLSLVKAFAETWEKLNGPRGFGWESNPWVWVLEFKRIEP